MHRRSVTDLSRCGDLPIAVNQTNARELERLVAERTAALQLLHDVATMANLVDSTEEAIESCLQRVCHYYGWAFGQAYLPAADDPGTLLPAYAWNGAASEHFTHSRELTLQLSHAIGGEVAQRVLATGKPECVTDNGQESPSQRSPLADGIDIKSTAGFPILIGERVVGVLEFFADTVIELDSRLLVAMTDVGMQIGRVVERENALHQLRTKEAHYQALVETAGSAIVGIRADHTIFEWNCEAERIFGWSRHESLEKDYLELVVPKEVQERVAENIRTELAGTPTYNCEYPVICRGGNSRIVSWNSTRLVGAAGQAIGVIAIGVDVTERIDAEQRLRESRGRLNLALSASELGLWDTNLTSGELTVDETAAEEQRRIGQELHDGIGGELTGIGFRLQGLIEDLKAHVPAEAETASKIGSELDRVTQQVRLLSHGLNPVELDRQGLALALDKLAKRTTQLYRVHCEFHCDGQVEVEDNFVADHLYRIAQEAATNSVKHGAPENIDIMLGFEESTLILQIVDDGIGIQEQDLMREGVSLCNMRYRAGLIGADLRIEPGTQAGTLVSCRFASDRVGE